MIARMSRAQGLVTGLYTSPHLVEITERININGGDVTEDDFAHLASRVRRASENLVHRGDLPATPSFFEQVTAAAFLWPNGGLSGSARVRPEGLDPSNICRPQVCAITRSEVITGIPGHTADRVC
jgi:dihydrofolate synthase/folylpolyglutamate synthase